VPYLEDIVDLVWSQGVLMNGEFKAFCVKDIAKFSTPE
jgi:hypothetical protein